MSTSNTRDNLVAKYVQKKKEHDALEKKIRDSSSQLYAQIGFKRNDMRKEESKIEGFLKAMQNVGEMIGEVLKEDEDRDRCSLAFLRV